jgi:hypothetical protein
MFAANSWLGLASLRVIVLRVGAAGAAAQPRSRHRESHNCGA